MLCVTVFENFCGVSACNRIWRYLAVHDGTALNNRPFANFRSRQNQNPRSNPDKIADNHIAKI